MHTIFRLIFSAFTLLPLSLSAQTTPLSLSAQATPLQLPVVQSSPVYYSVFNHLTPNSEAFYPVLHFGIPSDTLDLPFMGYIYPPPATMPGPECVSRIPQDFRQPLPGELTITIYPNDTTEIEDLQYGQDTMTLYKAIAVIVANQSFDTLVIGTAPQQEIPFGPDMHVGLVLEGKDENGSWRALESPVDFAETDNALVLPGRQIAVTSVYLYDGNFETDLRLRLGEAVSETYRGRINPAAFR